MLSSRQLAGSSLSSSPLQPPTTKANEAAPVESALEAYKKRTCDNTCVILCGRGRIATIHCSRKKVRWRMGLVGSRAAPLCMCAPGGGAGRGGGTLHFCIRSLSISGGGFW